jgi:exosortase
LRKRFDKADALASLDGWWYLLLVLAVGAAYWDVGVGLARQWATDDNYSHGFLIAPLAVYFAWQKRADLAALPVSPSAWGTAGVLAAAGLFVVGRLGAELFLTRVSLVVLVAAAVAFLFGTAHVRALRFPLLFLLLMVPLPAVVFNQIAFPLQLFASQVGEVVLRAAGVPVLRDGNVLELETLRLEVVEACSGIRSLISLLAFALVLGHFGGGSTGRMWLLALATVPIAIAANAARVAGTGLAAQVWGSGVADGAFHATAGAVVVVVAAAAIFVVYRASGIRRVAV